ncbi:CDP-glucose 4,6-dehydratase [subsurface metagenome]
MQNNIFNNVYNGKKILVTGHTGFKGGWLSLWLKELGAEVIGYSLDPPTKPSFFEAVDLKNKIIHIIGDVRDEKHLLSVFEKYQPEFVFHLAAQSLVRFSYKEPRLTYETNVIGTVNILEAIRKSKSVKAAVVITSDKCYENKEWIYGYRENDPVGGYDPYSSSKGCVELVVSAYRRSFFNPTNQNDHKIAISSARAGNVIGGGDWREDRLIPDCLKSLSEDRAIIIRNPEAVRPWQHVLEPLNGYLLLGARMYKDGAKYNGAWNFGPSDSDLITVEEITKKIVSYWGSGKYKNEISLKNPHEAKLLKLDCSKARSILNWYPAYNIDEALSKTVGWYKMFYDEIGEDSLFKYTIKQIRDYEKRCGYISI